MGEPVPPHPYLTREETNEILEKALEFNFEPSGTPRDYPEQRVRFNQLCRLIAGAIAEWADLGPTDSDLSDLNVHIGDNLTEEQVRIGWERLQNELIDWAQEYLVG